MEKFTPVGGEKNFLHYDNEPNQTFAIDTDELVELGPISTPYYFLFRFENVLVGQKLDSNKETSFTNTSSKRISEMS